MGDVLERAGNVLARVKKNQGTTKDFANPDAVLAHIEKEIMTASEEAPHVAKRRLEALNQTIEVAKGEMWEGTTPVKLPVYEDDTTTAKEKTDKPGSLLSKGLSANDFDDWGTQVQKRLQALKSDGDLSENEDDPKPGKKGKKEVGKRGGNDGWPADLAAPGGGNDDDTWGNDN